MIRRLAAATLAVVASGRARADDVQYRHLVLADGRELDAIVLATEDTGFRVQLPQGETHVSFDELYDMRPITAEAYVAQADWVVWVAVDEWSRVAVVRAVDAIPAASVWGETGAPGDVLTAEQAADAQRCGIDGPCVAQALRGAPWMWIVSGAPGDAGFEISATTNRSAEVRTRAVDDTTPAELLPHIYELLEITPTGPLPTFDDAVRRRRPVTRDRLVALSFVPLPGAPSLFRGDMAGFGLAMATTVPASALWIGAVGHTAQSSAQHVALGIGGYYVATVAANQLFGLRRMDQVAIGVAPQPDGANLTVTVSK